MADLDLLHRDAKYVITCRATNTSYQKGEILFREGQPTRCLAILQKGDVEITVADKNGARRHIAQRSAGAIIGEMSYLMGTCRTAQAQAMTPVSAMLLPNGQYFDLLK